VGPGDIVTVVRCLHMGDLESKGRVLASNFIFQKEITCTFKDVNSSRKHA
jgi:hypothetical protein